MSTRSRVIRSRLLRAAWRAAYRSRFGLAPASLRRARIAEETRLAFEDLGPTFIKLGQVVSVRPDLFWPELVFEMERLQDCCAPVETAAIEDEIAVQLGARPRGLFESFDPVPLASASIAQVHRATLRQAYRPVFGPDIPAGTAVAVKVVRPGARELVMSDIEVARSWARRAARSRSIGRFDPEGLIEELAASLDRELDLRNEGRTADRFDYDFRDDELMVVPRTVWSLTTTHVLTMEYVEGWRLSELDEARRAGIDGLALARHGAQVFMRQVLVLGRFHADLHPANIFVTPDGRICYLDFGIMGQTTPDERVAIAHVLAATVYRDADRAVRYSRQLGLEIPPGRESALVADVHTLMEETLRGGATSDVRAYAIGFLRLLYGYGVRVPVGYGLLVKALVTVEGVSRALYPEIDITAEAGPFATTLIAAEMSRPQRLAERMPAAIRAALTELAR
jgi:ubiquinone biosynthesis protein